MPIQIYLFIYIGLWGLVNNAGVAYLADLDMTSEKIMRNIMEVNLFGMVRITKRFLPLVRKSQGRIINLSSLAGIFSIVVEIIKTGILLN